MTDEGTSSTSAGHTRNNKGRQICSHFARRGSCKFGDECRFSHDLSDAAAVEESLNAEHSLDRKIRTEVCRHFERWGQCKFGNDCRFLHDTGVKPSLSETSSTATTDPFNLFEILLHRKMANCTSAQIAQFVRACGACLQDERKGTSGTVLDTLGGSEGVVMLRNMFGSPKSFVLEKASGKAEVSVMMDLYPVLKLAISPGVLNTAMQMQVNMFLQAVGRCFDWNLLEAPIKELLDKMEGCEKGTKIEGNVVDMVHSFVHFLLELVRRFDCEFLKEIAGFLPHLVKLDEQISVTLDNSRSRQQLNEAFLELTSSVAQKTGQTERMAKLTELIRKRNEASTKKSKEASYVAFEEPPGDLHVGGPRHDNDHADIQAIRTAPTEEEILCEIPSYLPPNKAGTVAHLPLGSVNAHRDLHFRLLRHNLVTDIHAAIISFRDFGGIKGLAKTDTKSKKKSIQKELADIRTDIYRDAKVEQVIANQFSGVSHIVSFRELDMMANKSDAWKQNFWKKTRRLAHGSLAGLCWQADDDKLNLVFGVISERKEGNLSAKRPFVGFRCIPNPFNEKVLSLIHKGNSNRKHPEIVLLQAGPSFFAYHPVLEALKNAPIPLRQYITQPPPDQNAEGVPDVQVPKYAEGDGTFSLAFLCPDVSPTPPRLRHVKSNQPEDFPIDDIVEYSTLDRPQAEALKTALYNEMALIQGPPGTGKTFLGIQIVKVLLSFSYPARPIDPEILPNFQRERCALTPILCVCYTNHALDQFLAGLLDAGVRGIVRVGGNSRSERLQPYNLRNKEKPTLGRSGYELRKNLLPRLEKRIVDHAASFEKDKKCPKWGDVSELILAECPAFIESLEKSDDVLWGESDMDEVWEKWNKKYRHTNWNNDDDEEDVEMMESRPLEELLDLDDFWNLTKEEHMILKDHWKELLHINKTSAIKRVMEQYESAINQLHELQDQANLSCLQRSTVVGMTTTFVAKHQKLLAGLRPRIVILEEAAEVLEAHVLTCLSSQTEHVIMIGDHRQLRPKVDQYMLQAVSGSGFDLDVSLFERLITQNHLPHALLETQRRMRPQFSQLIRQTVYPHLKDHEQVEKYPDVIPGVAKTLYFFDHDHNEEGAEEGRSHRNAFEADFVMEFVSYLIKQQCFSQEDIAVVTPYVGQLLLIKNIISKASIPFYINPKDEELIEDFMVKQKTENELLADDEEEIGVEKILVEKKLQNCMRLATIDNFQGEEARIVILSLVRNNKQGRIGFLGEKNRINVLLSRAKEGMYILGNAESLIKCTKSTMWKEVIEMLKEQNCIGPALPIQCQNHPEMKNEIVDYTDFQRLAGGGGCQLPCQAQLPCGHICKKRCHVMDRNHTNSACQELVTIVLPCGHVKGQIPCHEAKSPQGVLCLEPVEVTVDGCQYGHKYHVRCYMSERFRKDPANCTTLMQVEMPGCGHKNRLKCCEVEKALLTPSMCRMKCGVHLQCGHECKSTCGKCIVTTLKKNPNFEIKPENRGAFEHLQCESLCKKSLLCGHECQEVCHSGTISLFLVLSHSLPGRDCGQCAEQCAVVCVHRPRGCTKKCSDPCVPCAESCRWECAHRGKCQLPCGVPCDRLPCDRRCDKLLSCGCRCPSLCGEKCPTSKYCLTHGSAYVKKMDVDVIMFRKYEEVSEEELTQDPLIVLECGHAFLMSTLDGHMELEEFYKMDKYNRWVEPIVGDRFMQFDQRKACMLCRKPIVNIGRYGRVINKTAIDLMERAFIEKFEIRLRDLNAKVNEQARLVEVDLETGDVEKDIKSIQRQQKELLTLGETFIRLVSYSESPPTKKLYEKTKGHILGALLNEAMTKEERNYHLERLPIPKPDQTRPCRAYVSYGNCVKLAIEGKTKILQKIKQSRLVSETSTRLMRIEKTFEDFLKLMVQSHDRIGLSLNAATNSHSNTRIVDACRGSLQIHLASLIFTTEAVGTDVAKARKKDFGEHKDDIKNLQKAIIDKAEEVIVTGNAYCTSEDQKVEIGKLADELHNIKQLLKKESQAEIIAMLKLVIIQDPNLSSANARGHIHRCPNGHYYIIGECGQPNQQSRCPDCGRSIGGSSHNFVEAPQQLTTEDISLIEQR